MSIYVGDRYANWAARRWPGVSAQWNDEAYRRIRALSARVHHLGAHGPVDLVLSTPNEVCRYRAETFSTKEPETLEWIDRFGSHGAFYDVGANVGLYSLYFAMAHTGRVYAFEPSALNLGLLARNISANGMASRVVVIPNPLCERNEIAAFRMSMLDEGGAMSSFGEHFGHDGELLESRLEYETAGMSLDFMLESGLLTESPAMIKIDVDGIEHLILRGARRTLALPSLRTVLIEVNDRFLALAEEVTQILNASGFQLVERRHSEMFDGGTFGATFNQIWVRTEQNLAGAIDAER